MDILCGGRIVVKLVLFRGDYIYLGKEYRYFRRICIFTYTEMFRILSILSVFAFSYSHGLRDLFETWANEYSVYFHNDLHKRNVFTKWLNNHRYIEEVNSKNLSYVLGHNQFSGMDSVDYKNYLMVNAPLFFENRVIIEEVNTNVVLPESIDWVAKGAVTEVKDQGQCGSCWSFSTTGALEGAYFLKYGVLKSFSEQQLVDCDTFANGGRDHGCDGGLMDNAFNWIGKNGGLCTEQDYPYVSGTTQKSGTCKNTCTKVAGSAVVSHTDIAQSDNAFMTALLNGPVSVAIDASNRDYQLYKSGVYVGECGNELDHGVLLVGYGEEVSWSVSVSGLSYYKIKNSWGENWGESGYMRMGRGAKYGKNGQCGILLQGSYPTL